MKKLIMALGSLVLAGCATGGYSPGYFYNEVYVRNLSGASISDVSVQVGENGSSFSCDQVDKNSFCADRFGKRRYNQNGIELGWTQADGSRKAETMNPDIPGYIRSGEPLRVIIEIRENSTVKPYLEQDEPDRDGGMVYY